MASAAHRSAGLCLAALLALSACHGGGMVAPPAGPPPAEPAWRAHVQPLLAARCGTCHGGDAPAAGLDVTHWDRLVAGSDHGEALIAFDAEHSLMLELAERLPAALPEGYVWRHRTAFEEFREAHRLAPDELETLRRWIASGARNDDGRAPFDDPQGRLFVAVQDAGMAVVIDPHAHVVARTVHFDGYGGRAATPHDTEYEPDGSAWYITLIGAQRVVKLDATTHRPVAELDVSRINPTYRPGMLALDPAGDRLYLSRSISDLSGGRSIVFIDRRTMQGEEVLVPYTRPHPIGLTGDGRYVLSGSLADNLVTAIDAETMDLMAPLRVDGTQTPLMHYAVAPDGRTAVITGQFSNLAYVIDIEDPENLSVRHAVPVGQEPWYPAYSADGRLAIIPNHRSNDVSIIDVASGEVVRTIEHPAFAMPHGSAATPDGRYLFISNANLTHDEAPAPAGPAPATGYQPRYPLDRSGDGVADNLRTGHVAVIDARTFEVIRIIELEAFPSGMSLWQAGYPHR
jgi:DNA-binding beta-propeller fold protein YncE